MCGIVGFIKLEENPAAEALGLEMTSTLQHRGPDGKGSVIQRGRGVAATEPVIFLGHRRLKVIDLRPEADQPMQNLACVRAGRARPLVVVFNGEIYNFRELRAELKQKGHRFQSHSDTEVILHLYEERGVECVKDLHGMFAFALWDEKERTLFAARDRVGKKPFFYYLDNHQFLFASEPRAILVDPGIRAQPDLEALNHYLTYGCVPRDFSAFQGVRKLLPGHYLILKDWKLKTERYWKLSYGPKLLLSEKEAIEELHRLMREAIQLRMLSDVPLGAFLSGGIDSAAVVALMSQESGSPVKTFSIGFEEKAYDELSYARLVARKFDTDHHELVICPDAMAKLPQIVWHYGEPFADSSAIPTFYLAEMARQHVTVALNGDGGDENFAGYDRYFANRIAAAYDLLPLGARRLCENLAGSLPGSSNFKSPLNRVKRFFNAVSLEPRRRYGHWLGYFLDGTKENLYTPEFREKVGEVDSLKLLLGLYEQSDAEDFIDATLDVDVSLYLVDDLLVKMDIATMAYGLEARSPLLDQKLMEFLARLPSSFKLRRWTKKYIFKKALQALLPQEILKRRKMGFGVPLDQWFRNELKKFAYDVLLSSQARERGYFRPEAIQQLLDEHSKGQANHQYLLWNLLMLELWHRTYIDSRHWINGPLSGF